MKFTNPDTVLLCGVYLVTDPCYIPVLEANWGAFCDAFTLADTGGLNVWCSKMPVMNTAYGDGGYPVYKNGMQVGSFGVDTGLYAFVPMELVADDVANDLISKHLATKVEFSESTPIKLGDCYGDILVGDVRITTSGTDESESEDDDIWYDDDEPDDKEFSDWDEAAAEDAEKSDPPVDSSLIL